MQSRRAYLTGVAAALAATAGCLSEDNSSEGPSDRKNTATETPEQTPTEMYTVSNVAVKEVVSHYQWPGSTEVLAPADRQFLLLGVSAPDATTSYVFEADGQSWRPGLPDDPLRRETMVAGRQEPLVAGEDRTSGYLVFTLPSPLEASDPRLRTAGGDLLWRADSETTDRLAQPSPSFTLETLDVPEQVEQPRTLSVSMTVTNTSSVAGRFMVAVHLPTQMVADDDESRIVEREIDAGATESISVGIDTEHTVFETETVRLTLTGSARGTRTVTVVRESPESK